MILNSFIELNTFIMHSKKAQKKNNGSLVRPNFFHATACTEFFIEYPSLYWNLDFSQYKIKYSGTSLKGHTLERTPL